MDYKIINPYPNIGRGKDGLIEACAKFNYKGFEVSFSTLGQYSGACRNCVVVLNSNSNDDGMHDLIGGFHTVEDAIKWIDGDDTITDYIGNKVERKEVNIG